MQPRKTYDRDGQEPQRSSSPQRMERKDGHLDPKSPPVQGFATTKDPGDETDSQHQYTSHSDPEKTMNETAHHDIPPASQPVTAQDWTGPDDPENPHNWSLLKRCLHIFPIAFLSFAVTAGSSLITPSTPEIAQQFSISRTVSILSLSLFVFGLGIGPMIAAPISETLGRNMVYKISGLVYMLFILGAGFSETLASLLVCRFFAGVAGGPVLAVGAGTNADVFPLHLRAVSSSFYIMAPFLGPSIGPVIGGFAAQFKGWRWTQWCTIFIALAAYLTVLPMQETYKKVILQRRAKRLGTAPPPAAAKKGWAQIKMVLTITLARPLHMLATEPIVSLFSAYNAFTFGVLFAFFAAYPYTFQTVYGFNTWQYGLTFLGIGVGVLLGLITAITIDRQIYMRLHRRAKQEGKSVIAPEHRLYVGMAGAFGVPIGLFWFAWTAQPQTHWISPVLAGIPFAWGNLCVFVSAATYLIDVYGALNGASAMAANGLARYTLGAVFPLFTFQMYRHLGIAWATSLLGFVSVAMLPIPWVFYRFGPGIRGRSGYDTLKV
ncbi:putative MFS polyamine transporter [Hortaea werneckii]|nr:putative MFS polyamine transporter [Hortaea werneckii]KAI7351132.1 putative MFS polyamine transporter [Hortaea werneckii]